MKRSSFLGFISLALACAVAAFAHVAETAYATCRAIKNLFVDNFPSLATTNPPKADAVPKLQARQYRQRIEKRERPVVTSAWRMCPSI